VGPPLPGTAPCLRGGGTLKCRGGGIYGGRPAVGGSQNPCGEPLPLQERGQNLRGGPRHLFGENPNVPSGVVGSLAGRTALAPPVSPSHVPVSLFVPCSPCPPRPCPPRPPRRPSSGCSQPRGCGTCPGSCWPATTTTLGTSPHSWPTATAPPDGRDPQDSQDPTLQLPLAGAATCQCPLGVPEHPRDVPRVSSTPRVPQALPALLLQPAPVPAGHQRLGPAAGAGHGAALRRRGRLRGGGSPQGSPGRGGSGGAAGLAAGTPGCRTPRPLRAGGRALPSVVSGRARTHRLPGAAAVAAAAATPRHGLPLRPRPQPAGEPGTPQALPGTPRISQDSLGPPGDPQAVLGTPRTSQDPQAFPGTPRPSWDPQDLPGTPRPTRGPPRPSRDPQALPRTPLASLST